MRATPTLTIRDDTSTFSPLVMGGPTEGALRCPSGLRSSHLHDRDEVGSKEDRQDARLRTLP